MTGGSTDPLLAARRADSDRRRQKVLDALTQLTTSGEEITVSAVARTALLTEQPDVGAGQELDPGCE